MWSTLRNADMRINIEQKTLEVIRQGLSAMGKKTTAAATFDTSDIAFIKNEIQKKDITFITLLKYLSSRIPGDVYLKSIEFGGDIQPDIQSSSTQKTQNVSPSGQPTQGPVTPSVPGPPKKMLGENYYPLTLKGYIFGEPDTLELTLFNLVLSLKQSGFIDRVEVRKENNKMKGKPVMEFVILARCMKHEL